MDDILFSCYKCRQYHLLNTYYVGNTNAQCFASMIMFNTQC